MESKGQIQFVLDQLHQGGYKKAVAAGECIRDGANKILPAYIEILVDFDEWNKNIDGGIQACLFREVQPDLKSHHLEFPDVDRVFTMQTKHDEMPVDFVVLKQGLNPKERIEYREFGFNQIGYDGKNIILTPNYIADVKNKTITLCVCESKSALLRAMNRYAEMIRKYPDYELIIPDTYLPYVSEALH